MPFVQTMPIMRLGHCVPKVKLPSCQFPLYAYLALSMAFFGFKISSQYSAPEWVGSPTSKYRSQYSDVECLTLG